MIQLTWNLNSPLILLDMNILVEEMMKKKYKVNFKDQKNIHFKKAKEKIGWNCK